MSDVLEKETAARLIAQMLGDGEGTIIIGNAVEDFYEMPADELPALTEEEVKHILSAYPYIEGGPEEIP